MSRGAPPEESMPDAPYMHMPDEPASPGKLAATANGTGGASTLPPNVDHIVIKNHFPVARIKRIMQADDDVGKVAQVTPVVVSKALELFMISLVTRAAAEARARNSKRVNTLHLKQAITNNDQFDFLNDIAAKVADAPEKSETDAVEGEGGKKKKTSSRRKKKTDDDESF
ncbi:histone-fold-containing protein [Ampelomyces quisqualis]|uniref:NCT transcriptional regulatory complex subunit A n=1 Tax=Ampelomyces quisqualis TaxID=50730 RepID=A0A6A5QRI4_AMPQU|nr:histone-fold-containing protein [Ampelomyces quisqualis]